MKPPSRAGALLVVATALAAIAACSSGTSGGGGSGSSSSSFCYQARDGSSCDCYASDHASSYSASTFTVVTACQASAALVKPACCVDTDVSGQTTSCLCHEQPNACRGDDSSCACPGDSSKPVVTSCSKPQGGICCISTSVCKCGVEQYPGAGCLGFGGFNEDSTEVSSCSAPGKPTKICGETTEHSSCNGLTWKPPPPPSSSSGDDDTPECSSDSACSSHCSGDCYTCRSGSCSCGHRGSSGACLY